MILVLSPHLDDAAFSCGGWIASQRAGSVTVVTCFTRSVAEPEGFALACQLDKGLSPAVDYMAIRRQEDAEAMDLLGAKHEWWDLPEAPHRGYESAADLFAGIHETDLGVKDDLIARLIEVLQTAKPETIVYPYGAGNHADHVQVVLAVAAIRDQFPATQYLQYYDQPYTRRHLGQYASKLKDAYCFYPGWASITAKFAACRAYRTQVGFQFGDDKTMEELLGDTEYFAKPPVS
ncbi:PIG-L deacetylase family protein [Lewinella sp. IMCC34191]|uniref:PIG-L deacetylase family protein n=1 Tax=Lewinella sp. IMCC34191 TaxID=2259172 RepID=UPI000E2887EE|nr:PIG-L family deacetylase [Lewinella sp. IMCC34191]